MDLRVTVLHPADDGTLLSDTVVAAVAVAAAVDNGSDDEDAIPLLNAACSFDGVAAACFTDACSDASLLHATFDACATDTDPDSPIFTDLLEASSLVANRDASSLATNGVPSIDTPDDGDDTDFGWEIVSQVFSPAVRVLDADAFESDADAPDAASAPKTLLVDTSFSFKT